MNVESVNHWLAILTLLSLGSLLLLGFAPVRAFVSKHGLWIGFLIALGGMGVSLYYSNVVHYAPCVLCWYQRIFFYPSIVILGIGAWKKDAGSRIYTLALCLLGGLIGLYQVLLEHGLAPEGVCGATGPSCTARYVYEYGFVTIPFMSLTGFVLIATSVYLYRRNSQ